MNLIGFLVSLTIFVICAKRMWVIGKDDVMVSGLGILALTLTAALSGVATAGLFLRMVFGPF